jgi:predicted DNA-binding protein (UPF0278 family)
MPRRELSIPPKVAKEFVRDMRAFFKAGNQLKEDEIAAATGRMLRNHLPPRIRLRLTDVKQLFLAMRDEV